MDKKGHSRHFLFIFCLCLIGLKTVWALPKDSTSSPQPTSTEHLLFEPNRSLPRYFIDSVPSYGLYVGDKKVKNGDVLLLENGERIAFQRLLGSGNFTIVLLDQEGRAVRLTQFIDALSMQMHEAFFESYLFLRSAVPKHRLANLEPKQYRSYYAHVVEFLPVEQLLSDYLQAPLQKHDPKFKDLVLFFKDLSRVNTLGDFAPFQIGYVHNRGWVLFDYGSGVDLNKNAQPRSTVLSLTAGWEHSYNVPKSLMHTLHQEVQKSINSDTIDSMISPNSKSSTKNCKFYLK